MTTYRQRHETFRIILAGAVLIAGSLAVAAEERKKVWPSPEWPSARPAEVGLDVSELKEAERYALSAGGSGMIVWHGKVVLRWGDQNKRYDIKSATKSFGATMLGVAIKDGKIELDAPARRFHPTLGVPPTSNETTGWLDEITVLHLATQTAGFEKPGGYEKMIFVPGTKWANSDGGPNWLAECVTLAYKRDVDDIRESPALDIITLLEGQGADVRYHDPNVPGLNHEGKGYRSVALTPDEVQHADCVMIVTDHTDVDYDMVSRTAKSVVDTRNVLGRA